MWSLVFHFQETSNIRIRMITSYPSRPQTPTSVYFSTSTNIAPSSDHTARAVRICSQIERILSSRGIKVTSHEIGVSARANLRISPLEELARSVESAEEAGDVAPVGFQETRNAAFVWICGAIPSAAHSAVNGSSSRQQTVQP